MTPSRRTVLRAGLAAGPVLAVAACSGSDPAPQPRPADPDVALRAAAVDRERALVAAHQAVLAAHPQLAPVLGPVGAEHARHLTVLGATDGPALPSGSPPTTGTSVPALVQAERDAAAAHARDALLASPALAAVLAQLAASEASHPVALT